MTKTAAAIKSKKTSAVARQENGGDFPFTPVRGQQAPNQPEASQKKSLTRSLKKCTKRFVQYLSATPKKSRGGAAKKPPDSAMKSLGSYFSMTSKKTKDSTARKDKSRRERMGKRNVRRLLRERKKRRAKTEQEDTKKHIVFSTSFEMEKHSVSPTSISNEDIVNQSFDSSGVGQTGNDLSDLTVDDNVGSPLRAIVLNLDTPPTSSFRTRLIHSKHSDAKLKEPDIHSPCSVPTPRISNYHQISDPPTEQPTLQVTDEAVVEDSAAQPKNHWEPKEHTKVGDDDEANVYSEDNVENVQVGYSHTKQPMFLAKDDSVTDDSTVEPQNNREPAEPDTEAGDDEANVYSEDSVDDEPAFQLLDEDEEETNIQADNEDSELVDAIDVEPIQTHDGTPPKQETAGAKSNAPKWPIGTNVRKRFPGHGFFNGKVVQFFPEEGLYNVQYSDGDHEDYDEAEMEKRARSYQRHCNKAKTCRDFDEGDLVWAKSKTSGKNYPAKILLEAREDGQDWVCVQWEQRRTRDWILKCNVEPMSGVRNISGFQFVNTEEALKKLGI